MAAAATPRVSFCDEQQNLHDKHVQDRRESWAGRAPSWYFETGCDVTRVGSRLRLDTVACKVERDFGSHIQRQADPGHRIQAVLIAKQLGVGPTSVARALYRDGPLHVTARVREIRATARMHGIAAARALLAADDDDHQPDGEDRAIRDKDAQALDARHWVDPTDPDSINPLVKDKVVAQGQQDIVFSEPSSLNRTPKSRLRTAEDDADVDARTFALTQLDKDANKLPKALLGPALVPLVSLTGKRPTESLFIFPSDQPHDLRPALHAESCQVAANERLQRWVDTVANVPKQ